MTRTGSGAAGVLPAIQDDPFGRAVDDIARRSPAAVALVRLAVHALDGTSRAATAPVAAEAARRLELVAGPDALVAPLDDETVAVVVPVGGAASTVEADALAERLVAGVSGPALVAGAPVVLSARAGVTLALPPAPAAAALGWAELALAQALVLPAGRVVVLDEAGAAAARDRRQLADELRSALTTGELEVVYQPVLDVRDQSLRGAEALVRWRHPRRGLLGPGAFLPLAEDTGLITAVTGVVLTTASAQCAAWLADGLVPATFSVSVNLSARDLDRATAPTLVAEALARTGLDPRHLALEVTEGALMGDLERATAVLVELRRLGVRIALDDFGTGYSSLAYLRQFPVDVVKIDHSFTAPLKDPNEDGTLIDAVIALSHALGLLVTAEGVETDIQLEALERSGCDNAQGWLWSPPVPGKDFPALVARFQPMPARTAGPAAVASAAAGSDLAVDILDALPVEIAVLDPDGTIVATNRGWQRAMATNDATGSFGIGANYLAECDARRGAGAETATLIARGIRAVLTGSRDLFSFQYDAEGAGVAAPPTYLLLATPAGPRVVVARLDISDRRRAERALEESEARLESIYRRASIGIMRLDLDGRIVDANPALVSLSGRDAAALDRLEVSTLWGHADGAEVLAQLDALLAGERAELSAEAKLHRPDGEVRLVHFTASLVHDGAGRPMSAVCTLDDVTDRQTLAEELSKARELELLGRLAAGIAHEINTPMQFISDNLTFLSDAFEFLVPQDGAPAAAPEDVELYQAEVPTALSDCREGVTRVSSIVRAMKAFGHPDGTTKENCDLNEIVSTTLTVARNELKYIADVRVDLGCESDLRCFRGAIGQVVLNLLVNAAQAIGEVPGDYGTIDVRTWSDDEHAHLAVKDTGAGIPEDVAPHIFEPFFTTKPVGTGTGQGLALAWSTIVERHGGRLAFESREGEGTTFVMSLPLVGSTPPPPRR